MHLKVEKREERLKEESSHFLLLIYKGVSDNHPEPTPHTLFDLDHFNLFTKSNASYFYILPQHDLVKARNEKQSHAQEENSKIQMS